MQKKLIWSLPLLFAAVFGLRTLAPQDQPMPPHVGVVAPADQPMPPHVGVVAPADQPMPPHVA